VRNTTYLGDCDHILADFPDESVDLILTDPPYGIRFRSNRQKVTRNHLGKNVKVDRPFYFEEVHGDGEVPLSWLSHAYRLLKPNCAIYIFCHWTKWNILYQAVQAHGFDVKNMIVMNKSNHGMGDLEGSFGPQHELLLMAAKGRHLLRGKRLGDVWNVPVLYSKSHRLHPEEKPLRWLTPAICASSDPGDLVLDPFAGSGSTLVAASTEGRDYCGIEVDPTHFDTMQKRLAGPVLPAKHRKLKELF